MLHFFRRALVHAGRLLMCGGSSLKIQHLVLQLAKHAKDELEKISRHFRHGVGKVKRGCAVWVSRREANCCLPVSAIEI